MRRADSILLLVALALPNCASTPPSTEPSSTPSTNAPVTSASTDPPPAADAEPTADVGELAFALTGTEPFTLFGLDDAVFAIEQESFSPKARRIDGDTIADATNTFATIDLGRALPGEPPGRHFQIRRMSGNSTGDLDVTFETSGGKMSTTADAHRRGGVWKTDGSYPDAALLHGPTWTVLPDGRPLRIDPDHPTVLTGEGVEVVKPKPGSWVPIATKVGAPAGCATRVAAYETIDVAGDEFIALGPLCTGKGTTGGRAVERWAIGKPGSTVETLPGAPTLDPETTRFYSIAGALYAVSDATTAQPRPYLARRDAKAWVDVSPEKGSGAMELVEGGGKLFVFFDDVGYRREGDAWIAFSYPKRLDGEAAGRWANFGRDGAPWIILDGRLYRLGARGLERVKLPKAPSGDAPLVVDALAFLPTGKPVVAVRYGEAYAVLAPSKR